MTRTALERPWAVEDPGVQCVRWGFCLVAEASRQLDCLHQSRNLALRSVLAYEPWKLLVVLGGKPRSAVVQIS